MIESPAHLLSFPARDDDRLRLALRGVGAAREAQGKAVAALRGELSNLSSSVQGLDGSFTTYRSELESTADALRAAGDEARMAERSADDWLSAVRC